MNKRLLQNSLAIIFLFIIGGLWLFIYLNYGVDIPRHDQWNTPGEALLKFFEGSIQFDDIFRQHNESIKLIPTSISILLAKLNGYYDTQKELLLSFSIKLIIIGLIFVHAEHSCLRSYNFPIVLTVFATAMLFSPNAIWANLWSITFERLLPDVSLLVNIIFLSYFKLTWRLLVFLILISLIAQYSYAGGIAIWPLTFIFILLRHQMGDSAVQAKAIAFIIAGIGSSLIYFSSYSENPLHTPLTAIFEQKFLEIFEFFCVFLGAPFFGSRNLAFVTGIMGVSVFMITGVLAVRERFLGNLSMANFSWVILGMSSLIQAALATIGRLPMSPEHALRTDYMSHALFLWVSDFVLLHTLFNSSKRIRILIYIALPMLSLWLVISIVTPSFWKALSHFHAQFSHAKVCYLYRDYFLDLECMKTIGNEISHITALAQRAETINLLRPSKPNGSVKIDAPMRGVISEIIESENEVTINGGVSNNGYNNGAFLVGKSKKNQLIEVFGYGSYVDNQGFWARFVRDSSPRKWRARIEKQHIAPKLNIEEIEIFYVSSETGDLYRVFFDKNNLKQ